jgi:uncharacterized membrane protein YiaA
MAIKEFLSKMISESNDVSAMRIMSAFSLLVGSAIAIVGLYMQKDLNQLSTLCMVFVGAAFGGKVAQKFGENKQSE